MDIFYVVHYICGFISLLSTAFLLFLVVKHSPKEMNVYRWFVFYLSATDATTNAILLIADIEPLFMAYWIAGGERE
jgi:hypothetical protein